MSRAVAGFLLTLAVSVVAWPSPACAQQDLIDNIMLLGRAETLRLPGVERVEDRPAEKNPPSLHSRMLEEEAFHRPLESRLHPVEAYSLEPKHSLLEEAQESLSPDRGPSLPRLPEPSRIGPGPEPPGAAARASGIPDLDDPGPSDGLTLDAAIERLIHSNRALQTLRHEIPQARADTLTAGLLGNPIVFWGASGTPYGRFSDQPGFREYPIIVSYLLDLTGRRKARVRVAQESERVIGARYQDEVRKRIDELQTAFVEVLSSRSWAEAVRSGVSDLDAAIEQAPSSGGPADGANRLLVERELTAMALEDAEERLRQARRSLAALLEIPAEEARGIEVFGFLRTPGVTPPPPEVLHEIARTCRPDLVAQRLSVRRAEQLVSMERSRVIRDTYILYEPWNYEVGQTNQGERAVNTWGISLFAPLPVFDRNQGNIQRARLEVSKMRSQVSVLEREVADEVDRVLGELETTGRNQDRIERRILPAVIRQRDAMRRGLRGGRIGIADYLSAQRDFNAVARYYREAVVRHRRSILRLNTAVGCRILP
jgi:cobalt-zinc-cadmium efflux system outer membrane protein